MFVCALVSSHSNLNIASLRPGIHFTSSVRKSSHVCQAQMASLILATPYLILKGYQACCPWTQRKILCILFIHVPFLFFRSLRALRLCERQAVCRFSAPLTTPNPLSRGETRGRGETVTPTARDLSRNGKAASRCRTPKGSFGKSLEIKPE